jgi:hypothetical protein
LPTNTNALAFQSADGFASFSEHALVEHLLRISVDRQVKVASKTINKAGVLAAGSSTHRPLDGSLLSDRRPSRR